jgi:hypothetical protein
MRGVASSSIARELHNVGLDGHPLAHRRSPNELSPRCGLCAPCYRHASEPPRGLAKNWPLMRTSITVLISGQTSDNAS